MEHTCLLSHPQRGKRSQTTMVNQQQLDPLRQGVPEIWKRWREESPDIALEVDGTDLSGANLVKSILPTPIFPGQI